MLETRIENEQFNSLPNGIKNHRSRNGFIANSRPDSAQVSIEMFLFLFFFKSQVFLIHKCSWLICTYILFRNPSGEMFNI